MGVHPAGMPEIPDADVEHLGPAMLKCTPGQRRFVIAALTFPTGKDWQFAKAAGYAARSHGALRVQAHRLMHHENVIAAMHEEASKRLRSSSVLGVAVIQKIARTDGHRDQLKAAATLLNRLGLHETTEHKVTVEHNAPQMLELVARLAAEIGVDQAKLLGANREIEAPKVIEGTAMEVGE